VSRILPFWRLSRKARKHKLCVLSASAVQQNRKILSNKKGIPHTMMLDAQKTL